MKKVVFLISVWVIACILTVSGCKKKEFPILETSSISGITRSSAVSGGIITNDRGETVIERGVCWSTGINPTIADFKTSDGAGAGIFTSTLSDLLPATNYYLRAYASNSSGTGYGMTMAFKTEGSSPAITTASASSIFINSVTLSGLVNANYITTAVTIEYGTTTSYGSSAIPTQSPVTGNTNQYVSVNITGLTAGTTYHFRIKAENSSGIKLGNDATFKTLGAVPTATTITPTNVLATSATLKGLVNPNYLLTTVTFEYGATESYGSSLGSIPVNVNGTSPVSVSASLTGLTEGNTYHYRVKAENSMGVSYANDMSFIPVNQSTTLVDIDGNYYPIVTIGTQKWMGANLKTTKYNDNTNIPNVTDAYSWIGLSTSAYAWYDNDAPTYKTKYGALYNFYAVSTGKLCPVGWHVPTDYEFRTFTEYLGGSSIASAKMKETGTVNWASPNTGATNASGFTALPGGQRDESGTFTGVYQTGFFWSSTPYNYLKPWYRGLANNSINVYEGSGCLNIRGFSVRCIKD